jgi:ABC-type branched-subunit amino acid transport system ATPase component
MITVKNIHIKEFRGVRDFSLSLDQKNFAVCGPNGTGKSGIVDALEFALTGNISRLVGVGTGDISLKDHGPHVDSRNNPEKAEVVLTVFIPLLNETVTLKRNVKSPNSVELSPDTPQIRDILNQLSLHPEISLSRREIIKYVLAEPGKRSKEVQALLRLDDLEKMRASLQKISNAVNRDLKTAESLKSQAIDVFNRAMGISRAEEKEIIEAANERRRILNLPLLETLTTETSLNDGLATNDNLSERASKVVKAAALADLKGAKEDLEYFTSEDFSEICKSILAEIIFFTDENINITSKEELLRKSLGLFNDACCPVCDIEWKPNEFRFHINEKLKAFDNVAQKRKALGQRLNQIELSLEKARGSLHQISKLGSSLTPPVNVSSITNYVQWLRDVSKQFEAFTPIAKTSDILKELNIIPGAIAENIDALELAVSSLPDATARDGARDYLVTAQIRLTALRDCSFQYKKSREDAERAKIVFDLYVTETDKALDKIYKDVEVSFMELYRYLNSDEGGFEAALRPSNGKLGFDVDFYGRGFFPPGAYHSEGHQDSMGLCLYLALMKHLLGDNFTFSVLDDVLMSVDSGHRRDVSRMLKEKFPNTQFVLTTHDEVWLRLMKSIGLIEEKSFIHFRKWTVDVGPTEWESRDIWKELEDNLNHNNVREAAALLRNYLEHVSAEICGNLRAKVEYRADQQFTLGDLLPNALTAFDKFVKKGKAAAVSWSNNDLVKTLEDLGERFNKARFDTNADQWQVNSSVHFNEWANLNSNDFRPLLSAFKNLLSFFKCDECRASIYLVSKGYEHETLKCSCGKTNIDFVTKKKENKLIMH